jgi:hypothetical protein
MSSPSVQFLLYSFPWQNRSCMLLVHRP